MFDYWQTSGLPIVKQNLSIMKISRKSYLLLLIFLAGCDPTTINGGYHDLGRYSTRIEAQNGAIADILKNYGSLPLNGDYKIKYSISKTSPTERSPNALWYNKAEAKLALELDLGSGVACRWTEVTRTVLEQALKSANSLAKIDSIAKPNQPIAQCQ